MSQQTPGSAQSFYYAGLAAVALVIIVAAWLLFSDPKQNTEPAPLPPPVSVTPELPLKPEPILEERTPVLSEPEPVLPQEIEPTQPEPEIALIPPPPPLPSLDDSDPEVAAALLALNWRAGLAALFNREEMVRNLVVTVDNVAQGQLVAGFPVLNKPEDKFKVQALTNERFVIASDNHLRYEPYLQLLESVSVNQLLGLKQRYQPLLDEAFGELGYPNLTFDQRLQQAIQVLLSTPEARSDAELIQPSVMYTYLDPDLEQLPEAQKQILRLAPAQQQRFKTLLRRYQQALQ